MENMENMTRPAVHHNDPYNDPYNDTSQNMENMTTPAVHHNDPYESIRKPLDIMSMVIYNVVCVLGVLGNGVVIWATGFRMKKTVSTVWYLNLAVADFLVTAVLLMLITSLALDRRWPFGWFMCKMNSLVFHMNMYASIFTLAVISVDRCVGVVYPVWARCSGYRTVRKASWVSLGVWVLALATSIPAIIFRDIGTYDGGKVQCSDIYALTIIRVTTHFVVGFVVPLCVIVSCYSVIIYRIRNKRSLAGQSGRSFKVIAAVIAAFFLCWLPYHIIRLIYACYLMGLIELSVTLFFVVDFGYTITFALALLNSCVNPLLYVFSQGFKDVFRCRSIIKVLEKAFAEESPQTSNTPTDPDVTSPDTEEPPQTSNTPIDPDATSPETEEPPQTSNTPIDPDVTSPETEEPPQASNTPTDPDVTSPEIALSETEGGTVPLGTQILSGDCPVTDWFRV